MARSRRRGMGGGGGGARGGGRVSNPGARGVQAGRQYPDTTNVGASDFFEASRNAARSGYQTNPTPFWGGKVDLPLPPAAGYWGALDILLYASGGSNGSDIALSTSPTGVDVGELGGAALINNMYVKDPANNQVAYFTDDASLPLVNFFSGQVGLIQAADYRTWPSAQGNGLSSLGSEIGQFLSHVQVPFMFAPGGLGVISAAAANLIPTLHLGFHHAADVFTTVPAVLPVGTVEVDETYLAAVTGLEPDDLGTTLQWTEVEATPTIGGSGASTKIQLGKTDGFLTTLALIIRDGDGFRNDFILPGGDQNNSVLGFGNPASPGNRIKLFIDTVEVFDEDINARMDVMYRSFPGLPVVGNRVGPVGVIVYTFRNSITNAVLGVDDGAAWLPASPATSIEVQGTPWGKFTSASGNPAQITALIGSIVPGPGGVKRGGLYGVAG